MNLLGENKFTTGSKLYQASWINQDLKFEWSEEERREKSFKLKNHTFP